jgi:hypothetical protein
MDANQVYKHSLLEKVDEPSITAGRLGRAFHNLHADRETLFVLRFKLKGPIAGRGWNQNERQLFAFWRQSPESLISLSAGLARAQTPVGIHTPPGKILSTTVSCFLLFA